MTSLKLVPFGQRAEAIECLRRAVTLVPGDPETRSSLGLTLAEMGRVTEALPHLEEAVRLRPSHAPSRHNLGVALAQAGRPGEAAVRLREAIALQPDYPEAWYNLGSVLKETGQHDEALASVRRAVELRPDYGEALNNLGLALTETGRPAEAVVLLRQAARLRPTAPEGHNNLGLALAELGRFDEAEGCYHEALRLEPVYSDAHVNLGNALKEVGRTDEALGCYQMALWQKPDLASARYNRGLALMQAGRWTEGWPEYEWRWRRGSMRPRHTEKPRWDGADVAGKTILLWCEQGLGDAIQFVRYAALVQAKGGRVVLECPPQLVPLFSTCVGVDEVVAEGQALPAFDVQAPLLSLPGLCATTTENVPAAVPYLAAEPERLGVWRRKVEEHAGFRVGLCWQGNRFNHGDRLRSIPLRCFAPLAAVEGVCLVSLQKGPGAAQREAVPFAVLDFGDELDPPPGGFRDAVALLASLDLLVTCDSALGHVAGAVGVPVWIALSPVADWRWLRERDDTPWYPCARLFRQERLGDWPGVFERMAVELRRVVGPSRVEGGAIRVRTSPGELLDRVTILEIKGERLEDPAGRRTVLAQLEELRRAGAAVLAAGGGELAELVSGLRSANARLWEVEEHLRLCERTEDFGPSFVALARAVYQTNDERAELKRRINALAGSALDEPKQYPAYR